MLHELEVHQIELEVQNAELREARERMELLVEKYTDLYDFAPVGYFALDEQGRVLEVNLTGAALLGVDRSQLIDRRFSGLVVPQSQPVFQAFLERISAETGRQSCEAALRREGAAAFWASLHGTSAISASGPQRLFRVAVSDITALRQAEEAQGRLDALTVTNHKLKREIDRREAVEESLKKSQRHQGQLLEQSHRMQEQLRLLSRQLLVAQEEERRRISRELHDVIAQTLTGINVRLVALKKSAASNASHLERTISRTQQLVLHSVKIVHRFARELRPPVLDDLGLIPALHTFLKSFRERTGIHVSLTAFAAVDQLDGDKRTVLYRVAQEALNNVGRHAHASRAKVRIQKLEGAVCMEIADNGKGFSNQWLKRAKRGKRLGLLGMRERLEMVGGKFTITSAPGKGTIIVAQIPLIDCKCGGQKPLRSRSLKPNEA